MPRGWKKSLQNLCTYINFFWLPWHSTFAKFMNLTHHCEFLHFATKCHKFDYFCPLASKRAWTKIQHRNIHHSVTCEGHSAAHVLVSHWQTETNYSSCWVVACCDDSGFPKLLSIARSFYSNILGDDCIIKAENLPTYNLLWQYAGKLQTQFTAICHWNNTATGFKTD